VGGGEGGEEHERGFEHWRADVGGVDGVVETEVAADMDESYRSYAVYKIIINSINSLKSSDFRCLKRTVALVGQRYLPFTPWYCAGQPSFET
jgi:hypothetical protein